jgi:hypothetical protein
MFIIRSLVTALLCASLIATALPAGAQPFPENANPPVQPVKMASGIIEPDGTIFVGTNFKVKHSNTGVYEITFAKGLFPEQPVFSCTLAGAGSLLPLPSCVNWKNVWPSASGAAVATFHFYSSKGAPVDAFFEFTAVVAPSSVSN